MTSSSTARATVHAFAIVHVTVVDTLGGPSLPDRTVVVRDGLIRSVRPSRPGRPAADRVVDGRGKYLVPGLWDAETHLSWTTASALPILVANGVTGVRDLGGDVRQLRAWRAEIEAGTRVGPAIVQVGPMLNGRSFNRYQVAVASPGVARLVVDRLASIGVDGLEVERRVPRDAYFAILARGKRKGLPLYGHVPIDLSPEEAARAGQATIDNLETIYDGRFRSAHSADVPRAIHDFLEARGGADALFGEFRARGMAVTPVLDAFASALHPGGRDARHELDEYVAASDRRAPEKPLAASDLRELRAEYPELCATVERLRSDGVTILAGTDIAGRRVPGFSLHRELSALGACGLTPRQVLASATIEPARIMGLSARYGTVRPGKLADLLLLGGDPVRDLSALSRIEAVVRNGRLYDRAALSRLLRVGEAEAATH